MYVPSRSPVHTRVKQSLTAELLPRPYREFMFRVLKYMTMDVAAIWLSYRSSILEARLSQFLEDLDLSILSP